MTEEELRNEHWYRMSERLGIMCGTDIPTKEQMKIATKEATKACEELRNEQPNT